MNRAGPPASRPWTTVGRRRRWPAWLAGILVVVALAGLGYLAYRLFRVPTHEVPDLVGLDEEAAEAQTAGFDWELDVETARSDEQPEPGAIIRTAPSAGESLAEGEPFLIVVSEGPEFRTLPDFAGQPLNEAETTLAELRLVALPPTQQFDETVPVGSVVSWSVPAEPALVAGDEVLPETEVALVVSTVRHRVRSRRSSGCPSPMPRPSSRRCSSSPPRPSPCSATTSRPATWCRSTPAAATEVPRGLDRDARAVQGRRPRRRCPTSPVRRSTRPVPRSPRRGSTSAPCSARPRASFAAATVAGDPADPGEQFKRGTAVDLVFL